MGLNSGPPGPCPQTAKVSIRPQGTFPRTFPSCQFRMVGPSEGRRGGGEEGLHCPLQSDQSGWLSLDYFRIPLYIPNWGWEQQGRRAVGSSPPGLRLSVIDHSVRVWGCISSPVPSRRLSQGRRGEGCRSQTQRRGLAIAGRGPPIPSDTLVLTRKRPNQSELSKVTWSESRARTLV